MTRQPNVKKEILEWIKILAAAALIALFVNSCLIVNSRIPSDSMENTIMAGDRIMGSRLSYGFGKGPKRGDIVVFYHKAEPGKDRTRLVKRVIGLPGETVDIEGDRIYIDGAKEPLSEPYLPEEMHSKDCHFEIPEECYLMLGDNRNHSADARGWSDPYVPKKEILGKVVFRYYPTIGKIR